MDLVWIWPLLASFLDTFSALFSVRASGTLKRGSGSAFKTRPLFLWISGSPRRASGGFPSRRELNFHFYSRSQKGLQNESQNGAFWAPKSPLYSLWGTLWEKWVPKKGCQKKVAKNIKKRRRFWGGPAAGGGALELKKSSKLAEKASFDVKDCT